MGKNSFITDKQDELIQYLIDKADHSVKELPPINQISQDLGISAACLREQIELLKLIGAVSAKPRKGLQLLEYQFAPAVTKSLYYAIKTNPNFFNQFSDIRNHLEKSFFIEAARLLSPLDIQQLYECVVSAWQKMGGKPAQIPHKEHRNFHLLIFQHVNNIFLKGILEAYWDTYEMVGMHEYADLNYLMKVWDYHQSIVKKIDIQDFQSAYKLLVEHMELINVR